MVDSKMLKPMGYFCCFFFIVCFIAIIYLILSDDEIVCKYQPIDYNILSLDSIGFFCFQNKCQKLTTNSNLWRIHGLWPSNFKLNTEFCCKNHKDTTLDPCCHNIQFNFSKLTKLEDELKEKWPDLKSKNLKTFWAHEWEKHGTCSLSNSKTKNQFEYFNTTLWLFEKFPVQKWLESKNINPTNDSSLTISSKKFREAIESHFGAKIYIICGEYSFKQNHFLRLEKTEMSAISTIRLCLDKNFNPINCPKLNRKCKDQIIYLGLGFTK